MKHFLNRILKKISKIKIAKHKMLLVFFWFLFFILRIRLFYLQVLSYNKYYNLLISQHFTVSELEPDRWNIYVEDKDWNPIALTENINLYQLYADPFIIWDSDKVARLLTPILYNHFCKRYKLEKVNKIVCIKNIEKFTNKKILKENKLVKNLTWTLKDADLDDFYNLNNFDTWELENLIKSRLINLLQKSYITKAYLWFYDDNIIKKLKKSSIDWLDIINNNYVYIDLEKINNFDKTINKIHNILYSVNSKITIKYLIRILNKRPKRYVKIADYINPLRIDQLKKLKKEFSNKKKDQIPLLHWIWRVKQPYRYYPLWSFLSHVLWYINNWDWVLWIEEYYNDLLKWEKWQIMWMDTPRIWQIWSSNLKIKPAKNWTNIYLTIDINIQKKLEELLQQYYYDLRADSISAVVINPFNWQIVALWQYPTFDPNNWKNIYKIKPLTNKYNFILTWDMRKTYVDIPILVEKNWKLKLATIEERQNPTLKKYIFKNLLWPRTFVDQVISSPYEPGSIFKTITEAIWIDSNIISLYDYYTDKWEIKVWPYRIRNVVKECKWYNTFLHALERSCNVWMVHIIMKIWKDIYYNYLQQLWFWKLTWIQLAWEEAWKISALEHFSLARFFNNSFWQWILITPIQIAVAYSTAVNWWYLIKPTIVKKIDNLWKIIEFWKFVIDKVFSDQTSKDIIYALYSTIYNWDLIKLAIKNWTIWWKTWTSQIAFKWKYQRWNWRTIWSFAGIVTKDNLKYVIVIRTDRPRKCQWWICSSGKIFHDLAKFIIDYEGIKK